MFFYDGSSSLASSLAFVESTAGSANISPTPTFCHSSRPSSLKDIQSDVSSFRNVDLEKGEGEHTLANSMVPVPMLEKGVEIVRKESPSLWLRFRTIRYNPYRMLYISVFAINMVNILVAAVTAIAAASWVRHYRHKIAIPWFTARKVPVEITTSSARAAETNFQQGLLGRIRRTAMKEYHGFGIISEGIDGGCHYTIAGGQGDPTCSLVSDPPTHLYTRQLKFAGLPYLTHLYRRGIAICTDIGAALSTCVQLDKRFLLWIGSDIEKTFCHVLLATIKHTIPKERDILRMKIEGRRPDAMKMLKDIYVAYKAEVILITSNP